MTDVLDPRAFLEQGPLVPVLMDGDTEDILWVGPQAAELVGYEEARWLEAGFWDDLIVSDDRPSVRDARRGVAASGATLTLDYRVRTEDGRVLWVTEACSAVSFEGEDRLSSYLLDVTERKNREVALWRSEERLRAILRNAPDAMVLTDAGGRVLNMNARAESLLHYGLAEITGSSIDPLLAERFHGRLSELREAFERDPDRRSLVEGQTLAVVQRDGTEVPVEIGMSLVSGSDGSRQILNTFRDLTARRRVEQQLRSSERRLRQIANVLPAMVSFIGLDGRFRFVNDSYAEWLGWRRHQIEGRLLREVIGEGLYGEIEETIESARGGRAGHVRGRVSDAAGRGLPVEISVVPQFDDEGGVDGFFLVIFDISHEVAARDADRRHREELAHVARVATLGELAASIAHELNQPLSAVVANAQAARRLLQRVPPDLADVDEALEDVAADARRAGEVIASMRQLLRRGESAAESLDLTRVVSDVVELLHSEAVARGVRISMEGAEAAKTRIRGDAAQLTQLFLNLVKNGLEAAGTKAAAPRVVMVTFAEGPASTVIEVSDNGPGFGTEDPETLFQPFVTRRREGLGMGLPIGRTIAEAHGGSLVGRSRPEGGAVLRLELPHRGSMDGRGG